MSDIEIKELSESESESESEPEPDLVPTNQESDTEQTPDHVFGGMLNAVLANHFEYEHGDGNTLNLAEALLLIRQGLTEQTAAINSLTTILRERLPPAPGSPAQQRGRAAPVKRRH